MQRTLGSLQGSGESRDHGDTDSDITGSTASASTVSSISSQLQHTGWLVNKLLPRSSATEAPVVATASAESLSVLNQHIVAAESCWFAAKVRM